MLGGHRAKIDQPSLSFKLPFRPLLVRLLLLKNLLIRLLLDKVSKLGLGALQQVYEWHDLGRRSLLKHPS